MALDYTLSCLRDMPPYKQCQKTLIVDGRIDVIPADWDVVQVPRIDGQFCWGRMWDAGVYSSIYDKIVYLDSDRLLPKNYLDLIVENVKDNTFVFTSRHYQMIEEIPVASCKKLLGLPNTEMAMSQPEFLGKFRFEVRVGEPFHGPSKNVMSGSTAFTKRTYHRLGGVDHWYRGHGAFADTDFHQQASVGGCRFVDLSVPELHFPHTKLGESNHVLSQSDLFQLSLDNFIYYCKKWKLPTALAEMMATRSGIQRPARYVEKKIKELS